MSKLIRTFDQTESEAIASISIDNNEVVISFQSNPNLGYKFGTMTLVDSDVANLNPSKVSIGSTFHRWKSKGHLIPIVDPSINMNQQMTVPV
jgi:hypothetical protein